MTLTFADGTTKEAVLLGREEGRMRVVVRGASESLELTERDGRWISEDCEPLQVTFEWQKKSRERAVTEADCLCSHELAARLIHLLWNGTDEAEIAESASLGAGRTGEMVRSVGRN